MSEINVEEKKISIQVVNELELEQVKTVTAPQQRPQMVLKFSYS